MFKNGTLWNDIDGNPIHAHGGWMLSYGGYFYWYGEDRRENYYVSCYRSKDLRNWEFRNHILTTESKMEPYRVRTKLQLISETGGKVNLERPKVLYNKKMEKLEEGQKFMTTSCCPSYIELVEKHIPDMKPYVSTTGSPMYYAARIAKEKHPDAKVVFVGPCVAKRKEVRRDKAVDYILTFEEIGSILDGLGIELEQVQEFSVLHTSVREAHGFAQAGGVMGAVKAYLKEEADKINAIQVSDINKKNIALLRACAKTGKAAGQFIEVMACEGGCITGPSTHNDIVSGRRQLAQELLKRKESYETMDR